MAQMARVDSPQWVGNQRTTSVASEFLSRSEPSQETGLLKAFEKGEFPFCYSNPRQAPKCGMRKSKLLATHFINPTGSRRIVPLIHDEL
jgi:hypothetical protein